jgi:hypothetical protein
VDQIKQLTLIDDDGDNDGGNDVESNGSNKCHHATS